MHFLGRLTNLPAPYRMSLLSRLSIPRPETGRLGNRAVQRSVVKVLAAGNGPARAADIHLAVERLLGRVLSKASVSCCLSRGIRGGEPRFERVAVGYYRLRNT